MAQKWFSGAGAPSSTPAETGSTYVDTSGVRVYISTGTSSSADWDIIPLNISEISIDADINLAGTLKLINTLGLDFQASTELTLSGGVITQTQTLHTIDTQGDAGNDDLDTITIATDCNYMAIRLEDNSRIVTLKHGTGNLTLPSSSDVIMVANVLYILVYNGTAWNLVGDPSASGSSLPVSDATSIAKGSIDVTKQVRVEVDTNVTTATTRILTIADKDMDLSDSVEGPATATNNAVPRYDATTGKLIQDSGVIIDDSDNISGLAKISTVDHLELTEIAAPSTPAASKVAVYTKTDGKLYIKDDAGTETDCTGAGGLQNVVEDTTPQAGGTFSMNSKQMQWSKGADVASGTALALGSDGNEFDITGTTTITSINTVATGSCVVLHFDGILTFTHHATDLILPGAANITTAAGDIAVMYEYATGDWRCVSYTKADGTAVASAGGGGLVKQFVYTKTSTGVSTTGTVPFDDTLMQSSEGGDCGLDTAITPLDASNLLVVTVSGFMGTASFTYPMTLGLFKDSETDATAMTTAAGTGAKCVATTLVYIVVAGSLTARTFKARFGAVTGTSRFLGSAGADKGGAARIGSMTIMEVTP